MSVRSQSVGIRSSKISQKHVRSQTEVSQKPVRRQSDVNQNSVSRNPQFKSQSEVSQKSVSGTVRSDFNVRAKRRGN